MPRFWIGVAAFALLSLGWYGLWHHLMSADVARVKASIEYHDAQFKTRSHYVTLKADKIAPSGFPFAFHVTVTKPSLSMVWGKQTFAVSIPSVELALQNSDEGRYKVIAPTTFDALYTSDGTAPEQYRITLNEVPQILLRAQGASTICPNMPGMKSCAPVTLDAPLVSFAVDMPENLLLTVELNGNNKQIGFHFTPLSLPVFMEIPKDATSPLEIFVGMLREAMIYQK